MSHRSYYISVTQPPKESGGERMSEFMAFELFGDSTVAALRAALEHLVERDDWDFADLTIGITVLPRLSPLESLKDELVRKLKTMSQDARLEVIREFCWHCGREDLPCHCWNDE